MLYLVVDRNILHTSIEILLKNKNNNYIEQKCYTLHTKDINKNINFKLNTMIEAIGWLCIAWVVMIVGKAIGKKIWPEDWRDEFYD